MEEIELPVAVIVMGEKYAITHDLKVGDTVDMGRGKLKLSWAGARNRLFLHSLYSMYLDTTDCQCSSMSNRDLWYFWLNFYVAAGNIGNL